MSKDKSGLGGYSSEMYYKDLLAERGGRGFSLQKNTKSTGKNATQSVSKGKGKGKQIMKNLKPTNAYGGVKVLPVVNDYYKGMVDEADMRYLRSTGKTKPRKKPIKTFTIE